MSIDAVKRCLKILLVEDEEVAYKAQYMALAALGHVIDSARNGLQAVDMYSNSYDIVILDCGLPDIDGFEVCKRMRMYEREHNKQQTPIIMLSAYMRDQEIENDCENSGISEYLIKPIFKSDFENIFKRWIK